MPLPSKDPGLGDSLSESIISFGMLIEGMLAGESLALDSATMLATAPAPTAAEESKNERRVATAVSLVVCSVGFAVSSVFMAKSAFLALGKWLSGSCFSYDLGRAESGHRLRR